MVRTTIIVQVQIPREQIRVSTGFSAADPGSSMLGIAVSRIGATAIPITGLTTAVSA
jgi:hypothetical protein